MLFFICYPKNGESLQNYSRSRAPAKNRKGFIVRRLKIYDNLGERLNIRNKVCMS
ncbi:hypothetical protein HMPREF0201_00689 [Cedecea davisae DSM 4568]|uniref:Uncharacterized protein n=1 Tax=Cedecea davisae DSM 4568 TaxID=566551 RepID=S3J4E1_9ENTR|nr:hypothetical protein HMPREF0201_00689 [Cedecea davisae DSM 4568]